MARHFLLNCRRSDRPPAVRAACLLPLLAVMLVGCASWGGDGSHEWRRDDANAARAYLLSLREYLAEPAGRQAAHRKALQAAAERGSPEAILEYALALSVDRDDRQNLELARELFESLLVAPDPLPVALDVLVRLQLGQVIDRLGRMRMASELREAVRTGAADLEALRIRLHEAETQREDMRRQLAEVRRKLDALARIEQTVNGGEDTTTDDEPTNNERENRENDDAERQPDTARR
ncbi:MAG TPA: hypothetical protein VF267_05045 [Gammaproteobacteria bacterium]